jgi:hypothetical protein
MKLLLAAILMMQLPFSAAVHRDKGDATTAPIAIPVDRYKALNTAYNDAQASANEATFISQHLAAFECGCANKAIEYYSQQAQIKAAVYNNAMLQARYDLHVPADWQPKLDKDTGAFVPPTATPAKQ